LCWDSHIVYSISVWTFCFHRVGWLFYVQYLNMCTFLLDFTNVRWYRQYLMRLLDLLFHHTLTQSYSNVNIDEWQRVVVDLLWMIVSNVWRTGDCDTWTLRQWRDGYFSISYINLINGWKLLRKWSTLNRLIVLLN
jgi:hypothetical protein